MHIGAAALPLALAPRAAQPQTRPERTLRLLVPYPAGGAVDYVARLIATPLQVASGQPTMVDNVSGAAGAVGLQKLLLDPADGSELAVGTDSDAILAPMLNGELRYKPGQFLCLGVINAAPMLLVAGPAARAGDISVLLKDKDRSIAFGSYGVGSNSELLAQDFARRASLNVVHVPYRGIAPLVQDLLSGQTEMSFLPIGGSVPEMVAAQKLRAVGIASRERHRLLPAVPVIATLPGFEGFVHTSWAAMLLPQRSAPADVARLHAAVQQAILDPEFRKQLEAGGGTPGAPMSLIDAQRFLDAEVQRYAALVAAFKARPSSASKQ